MSILDGKVRVTEQGCWEWTGTRWKNGGYGRIGANKKAHRLAYEEAHGPIPEGMFVCHSCDNPPCCNPEHLHLGTPADNMREKKERGRAGKLFGEAHGFCKVTDAEVALIRERYAKGENVASIARSFPHTSYGNVWVIARGKHRNRGTGVHAPAKGTMHVELGTFDP